MCLKISHMKNLTGRHINEFNTYEVLPDFTSENVN